MATKTIDMINIWTGLSWFTGDVEGWDLFPNFVNLRIELTNVYWYFSALYGHTNVPADTGPQLHKVTLAPIGAAYAGDGVAGQGAKRAQIKFNANPVSGVLPATVFMTRCEDVSFVDGWCLISKGPDVILYSPVILRDVIVDPTP